MNLKAVIFDLDGTIVDDEDEWGEAFGNVLRQLGAKDVSEYPHIAGIGIEENWPLLLKKYNLKTNKNIGELTRLTIQEYNKLIPRITLKEGFINFVEDLRESNIKTALATSSIWSTVEALFATFDIERVFDCVTTGEETRYKKPDPEIFILTAEKLGESPTACLVFEDSLAGIEAAKKAGMKVIGVARNDGLKDSLKKADLVIENFKEVTPEKLFSLKQLVQINQKV